MAGPSIFLYEKDRNLCWGKINYASHLPKIINRTPLALCSLGDADPWENLADVEKLMLNRPESEIIAQLTKIVEKVAADFAKKASVHKLANIFIHRGLKNMTAKKMLGICVVLCGRDFYEYGIIKDGSNIRDAEGKLVGIFTALTENVQKIVAPLTTIDL
jgi:hypothetical protein